MARTSLLDEDWPDIVERLGGRAALKESARKTGAFLRGREFEDAIAVLRMILGYCLGGGGLRSTAAWAASIGLADVANTALLYRLRQSGDWLAWLVGQVLASSAPAASRGRLIRAIDATHVPKAGAAAKKKNKLWRIHSAFDLPCERFGHFELTDEKEGERLDRIPVVKGEIRLADRAYLAANRIATVLDAGADIVIRAGWKRARWLDAEGKPFDLIAALKKAARAKKIDMPIWLGRKGAPALGLRLVAVRKPAHAIAEARRKARRAVPDLSWLEASIWTERMVSALVKGVKGGCWYSLIDSALK